MNAAETKDLLGYLFCMCPRAAPEVTPELARAWTETLAPFEAEDVRRSARDYAARKDFFPRAAELTAELAQTEPPPGREDLERMKRLRERIRAGAPGATVRAGNAAPARAGRETAS